MDLKFGQLGPKTVIELELEKHAQEPITLSFSPGSGVQVLAGSPEGQFNQPKAGQSLVATIPLPEMGVSAVAELVVAKSGEVRSHTKKVTVHVGWPD